MTAKTVRPTQFAQRLLRGRCRCWVVGDSINSEATTPRMPLGYIHQFAPTAWAGIGVNGFNNGAQPAFQCVTGGSTVGFGGTANAFNVANLVGDDPGGTNNLWPCTYAAVTPVYSSNLGAFGTATRWLATVAEAATFHGGDWWSGIAGKVRLATFQDAASVALLGTDISRNGVDTGTDDASRFSRTLAGYTNVDLTAGSAVQAVGTCDTLWRFDNTGYDETGKTHRPICARHYLPGVNGLEMFFGGVGGSGVADHINAANVSDAAIAAAVAFAELDTVIIWLGQNDPYDANWKPRIVTLIGRWRTAITAAGKTFRCLLVATYDTGLPVKMAAMAADLADIAATTSDVSFVNLYALAGAFAGLNAAYLGDGIHPNAAGVDYFAGLINTQLVNSLVNSAVVGCLYYSPVSDYTTVAVDVKAGTPGTSAAHGPMAMWTPATQSGYCVLGDAANSQVSIVRYDASVPTVLATYTQAIVWKDKVSIDVTAGVITASFNGVALGTVTDTTYTTGVVGIVTQGDVDSITLFTVTAP